MAASISRAAVTARAAAFGSSNGAPNSARKPSPRNLFTMPPLRSTTSTSTANAASSHDLLRRPRTRGGGKAANVDEHDGYAPGISGGRWARREQTLHDLRRHVLSKQIGYVIARGGGSDARFELPAQLRPDGTRDHAASEDHGAA